MFSFFQNQEIVHFKFIDYKKSFQSDNITILNFGTDPFDLPYVINLYRNLELKDCDQEIKEDFLYTKFKTIENTFDGQCLKNSREIELCNTFDDYNHFAIIDNSKNIIFTKGLNVKEENRIFYFEIRNHDLYFDGQIEKKDIQCMDVLSNGVQFNTHEEWIPVLKKSNFTII